MADATLADVHQPGPLSRLRTRRRLLRRIADVLRKGAATQLRWPAGAPAGQGGQFAPQGAGGGGLAEKLTVAQLGNKTGFALGTNPGGTYEGANGAHYVKQYQDHTRAAGEHLANNIYRELGVLAPQSSLVEGQPGWFASKIVKGGITLDQAGAVGQHEAKEFTQGFAADVLLGNWDAVGATKDNLLLTPHGLYRIDNGGSLLMRAQEKSGRKPEAVLDKIDEFDRFLDPAVNKQYADMMKKGGVTAADVKDPHSSFMHEVKDQVENIVAFRELQGGWANYIEKVSPDMNAKDKARTAQMLEARTKLLVERVGLAPSKKELAAAHTAATHNSPDGIKLPEPSSGGSYAAKGYNKGLSEMAAIINNPSLNHQEKIAAVNALKGPTEAHFFGKKFKSLKGEVMAQLDAAAELHYASLEANKPKQHVKPIPEPPVIPPPNNSGIHKAKWNQKAIHALHEAAQNADPLTAIGQIELGPSHSGTVKKYKQALLGWAAEHLPGSVDKHGKVTVASMPTAKPLGMTPHAEKFAQKLHEKHEAAKHEWETGNPIPQPPPSMSEYKHSEHGEPTTKTLLRIQLERAARTHPDLVEAVLKSSSFGYLSFSGLETYKTEMRAWAKARSEATGGLTGKKGDNISGFEIHEPSSTGFKPEPVPKRFDLSSHASFSEHGYQARKAIGESDKEAGSAITDYQGSGYQTLNAHLVYAAQGHDPLSSTYKKSAALQRGLTSKHATLHKDVQVIRNISSHPLADVLTKHGEKLQGATVILKTFQSSSLNGFFGSGAPVQLIIHAPKGTKGLYLNGGANNKNNYESEVLFPANTKVRIHSVKKADGRVVLEMTIVG